LIPEIATDFCILIRDATLNRSVGIDCTEHDTIPIACLVSSKAHQAIVFSLFCLCFFVLIN